MCVRVDVNFRKILGSSNKENCRAITAGQGSAVR